MTNRAGGTRNREQDMTQRLTDDEIRRIRMQAGWGYVPSHFELQSICDEIEERRRIDARRLADAEQAFREECERGERVIIDEHCPPISPETLAKACKLLSKFAERKDGGA